MRIDFLFDGWKQLQNEATTTSSCKLQPQIHPYKHPIMEMKWIKAIQRI